MWMTFGCNTQIIRLFFVNFLLEPIDTGYLVNATLPTILPDHLKLCRCFLSKSEDCVTLGCNPQISFCHFFCSLNLGHFCG